MNRHYNAIPQLTLKQAVSIKQPAVNHDSAIDNNSPAYEVITQLNKVTPATTSGSRLIKEANQKMIERAVRMLFVTDSEKQLQGIITSNDILGEKPIQFAQRVGCCTSEIQVSDIMTPINKVQILDQRDIEYACVGDVVETLKRSGRHHALVAEYPVDGQPVISGIISLSHISRLMNTQMEIIEIANTFVDIEKTLHH